MNGMIAYRLLEGITLNKGYLIFVSFLLNIHCAQALEGLIGKAIVNNFHDVANTVKSVNNAANAVNDGLKSAGNAIADRFKDTKLTRSIDYGARKAALEASRAVAKGVLEATEALSKGTLDVAERTANLAVQAAQGFVSQVGRNISDAVLIGSSQAAKGVLEGAKHTTLGVLQGTQWVVNNALGQIDINCIHYDGSLQDLKSLNLGNVRVKGKIIVPFDEEMSLNLSNPISSIESFAKLIANMMKNAFLKPETAKIAQQAKMPLEQALHKIEEGIEQLPLAQQQIAALQTPPEIAQAEKEVADAEKKIIEAGKKLESIALQAHRTIEQAALKSMDELQDFVFKHGTPSRSTRLFKEELLRRKKSLEKELQKTT